MFPDLTDFLFESILFLITQNFNLNFVYLNSINLNFHLLLVISFENLPFNLSILATLHLILKYFDFSIK